MKLVISEKPSVAASIAKVIGAIDKKEGYYEGNGYIVSWCVGHLVELANPEGYDSRYEKWRYESLPIIPNDWKYEIKKDTKPQYKVLRNLMHDKEVDSVVCATDAGREGELIFRLVYKMAGCNKPMERLWISSMEDSAIREGMDNLKPGSEYDNLYRAALARQGADWLVGINGTRLFTVLYGSKVLKVGRVQTPTLAMLVEREGEITGFKKQQYFMGHLLVNTSDNNTIDAVSDRIDVKADADNIVERIKGNKAIIKDVLKEDKKSAPPKLYDLTSLQRDANKMFGFTAKKTLDYTQSLYEKKLVTYPRTDSRYLTDDMEDTVTSVVFSVFEGMPFLNCEDYSPDIKKVMNSKKVSDHHAIIPTVEVAKYDLDSLSDGERKILFLDAVRLIASMDKPHLYTTQKAEFECAGVTFVAKGKSVTYNGWKKYEETLRKQFKTSDKSDDENDEEQKLPALNVSDSFDDIDGKVTEHFTKPPARYTESSLLSAMEKAGSADMDDDVERKGLGTPATRADIIEKLVKDGFVKREKKNLIPTDDGIKLITILPESVKSPKLTADWENTLTLIAKGEASYDDFMSGIKEEVANLVKTYHSVSDDDKKMFSENKVIGKCPNCDGDVVMGKFGAYCSNKCGMMLGKLMGVDATEAQVKAILEGKKVHVKGIKKKDGSGTYSAYLTPEQLVDCSYTKKDGTEVYGKQFKFKIEFPKKKD